MEEQNVPNVIAAPKINTPVPTPGQNPASFSAAALQPNNNNIEEQV